LTLVIGLWTLDFVNVLIVPDKFKGTLTAAAAAEAIARGWRKARPQDQLDLLPMSDGGDGFGEVVSAQLRAKPQVIKTVNAAHRTCKATWWWEPRTKTAIIESAKIVGLAMLPPGKFHPFELDTFGLGVVMCAAQAKGARRILLGIGGSATNDGGFGIARALGWEFLAEIGKPIHEWTGLQGLAEVCPPRARTAESARTDPGISSRQSRESKARANMAVRVAAAFGEVIVAVDVQNRLLGAHGATRIYGPQKGIRPAEFELAEHSLARLAEVMQRQFKHDFARVPGTGAAGGLGFGLLAFLGATLEPGFDLFAKLATLERRLQSADLVITGEGAIDKSTLMGKGVGEVARRCAALRIPCLGLAGSVPPDCRRTKRFAQVHALTDLTSVARAKSNPAQWLERLAAEVALEFGLRSPSAS